MNFRSCIHVDTEFPFVNEKRYFCFIHEIFKQFSFKICLAATVNLIEFARSIEFRVLFCFTWGESRIRYEFKTPRTHFLEAIENFCSSRYITYEWGDNVHDG